MKDLPIACDLTALTTQQRQWLIPEFEKLFLTLETIKPIPNGYAFKIKNVDLNQYIHIAKLLALDRLCCPFIQHEIVQPAGSMSLWLRFSAKTDIQGFLKQDILNLVNNNHKISQMFTQANKNIN